MQVTMHNRRRRRRRMCLGQPSVSLATIHHDLMQLQRNPENRSEYQLSIYISCQPQNMPAALFSVINPGRKQTCVQLSLFSYQPRP